jgi:hypothetical protein
MIKVWKSVGAVRVYSRFRAVLLALVVVAVLVGAGFAAGAVSGSDDPAPAAGTTTTAVASQTTGTKETVAQAYRRGLRAGATRQAPTSAGAGDSYRSGFKAGAASVLGGHFKPGSAYFVIFQRAANGALRIGPSVPAKPGFSYRLCREGRSVCERSGG